MNKYDTLKTQLKNKKKSNRFTSADFKIVENGKEYEGDELIKYLNKEKKEEEKNKKELYGTKWLSDESPYHAYRHELGHVLYNNFASSELKKEMNDLYSKWSSGEKAKEVTYYALLSGTGRTEAEFVAEAIANFYGEYKKYTWAIEVINLLKKYKEVK